jgi:hypothetical protein
VAEDVKSNANERIANERRVLHSRRNLTSIPHRAKRTQNASANIRVQTATAVAKGTSCLLILLFPCGSSLHGYFGFLALRIHKKLTFVEWSIVLSRLQNPNQKICQVRLTTSTKHELTSHNSFSKTFFKKTFDVKWAPFGYTGASSTLLGPVEGPSRSNARWAHKRGSNRNPRRCDSSDAHVVDINHAV